MSDEKVVEIGANAIEAECDTFSAPVRYYVRGEAQTRWERDNPGKDAIIDSSPRTDWNAESWKILARAALAALEKEGYAVVPFEAERMPLTQEERDSVVGITDYMRGAALSDPPKE